MGRHLPSCLGLVPPFLLSSLGVTAHRPCDSPPFQIKMLSDRKRELEHRLSATLEENDLLQGTVEELQDRVLILERQGQDKDLQVLRQRSCPLEPGQMKGALSCPAGRKLRGRHHRRGQERVKPGSLFWPCCRSPWVLTNLASLALAKTNASLPTGHPSNLF